VSSFGDEKAVLIRAAQLLWGDKEWDKKLRETVPDFRDAPTTKIKTAISFSMHL
jgi:hypothetical protein